MENGTDFAALIVVAFTFVNSVNQSRATLDVVGVKKNGHINRLCYNWLVLLPCCVIHVEVGWFREV